MIGCRFCAIAAGLTDEQKVYEDEYAYAFVDAHPVMPVHVLVVPKKHYTDLADGIPDDELGHLFNAVNEVACIMGIDKTGFRTIVNTGCDAQQSVFHLHIHVLGGAMMNVDSPLLS